jgi:hypothetical protein
VSWTPGRDPFAARLRGQVDLDALNAELLGVVAGTMQPTRASLWLRHRTGKGPGTGPVRAQVSSGPACRDPRWGSVADRPGAVRSSIHR